MAANNLWDDPEWERLRRQAHNKPGSAKISRKRLVDAKLRQSIQPIPDKTAGSKKKMELSLKLSVPKVNLTKKQQKSGLLLAGAILLVLIGLGVYKLVDKPNGNETTDVLAETSLEPEFDTVLPDGKADETSSGKVGYDPERKVASFKDKIGTVDITVSQQPLPEAFKTNPNEEVKKLAEGFSATEVINESNPRAYLGNDVNGPQTVIFHKNDLLIFILSNKPIEKDQWAQYITRLL